MAVTLKWKGDELFLGKTKMAEVRASTKAPRLFEYVLGPEDFVSVPYETKEDALNDCHSRVRDMLARAGA